MSEKRSGLGHLLGVGLVAALIVGVFLWLGQRQPTGEELREPPLTAAHDPVPAQQTDQPRHRPRAVDATRLKDPLYRPALNTDRVLIAGQEAPFEGQMSLEEDAKYESLRQAPHPRAVATGEQIKEARRALKERRKQARADGQQVSGKDTQGADSPSAAVQDTQQEIDESEVKP